MTVKVQCPCGAKYSFEVEPVEGRMPFRVNCPVCQADGTELANQIIAASNEPKAALRMQADIPVAVVASVARTAAPVAPRAMDRISSERRRMRAVGIATWTIVLLVLGGAGAWAWYTFIGTKPHRELAMSLPAGIPWHSEFIDPTKLLLVSPRQAIEYDVAGDKQIWSSSLAGDSGDSDNQHKPQTVIDKETIWVCLGSRVLRLNRASGTVTQTIPIAGQFLSFTPGDKSLVVVSSKDETNRYVLQINRASGEAASKEIAVPRPEKHEMPNELPQNVEPTEGALLAQESEHKFGKPLDAVRSELFSAGENVVELRATLVDPKVTWVKSIGSDSNGSSAERMFNHIKSSETGGAKRVDLSTYHVRVRRWLGGAEPVEWQGDVVGPPMFFSLETVDLMVAGSTLTVFDKQNNELFAAKLSYGLGQQYSATNWDHLPPPAVETNSTLYFFDAGVLTAFAMPAGTVKWRLTTVGVSHLEFDNAGAMYVDSTTASPQDIQYSEQISFEATHPVLLKVAPSTGTIIWQDENEGGRCFVSGKYVYTQSETVGGAAMVLGMAEALNQPRPEEPLYLNIYRIDPATGREMWNFHREEWPDEVAFSQNRFLTRFGERLLVWKFLDY